MFSEQTIRLSQQAKDHLIRLKARTGIQHWNVLCRWAFCLSLAEPGIPPAAKIPGDSNVEMTWKVFGGNHADIYEALLKERCKKDGMDCSPEILFELLRLHIHRGVGYLFGNKDITGIAEFLSITETFIQ